MPVFLRVRGYKFWFYEADLVEPIHVPWQGEAFGWSAEYSPKHPEPPLGSLMTFTPADFCIGKSDIWFFSLMWEHGRNAVPVEFGDEWNRVGNFG